MTDWKHQHGLSDDDVEEMISEAKSLYISDEISEEDLRRRLGKLGLTASEIDEIVSGL